MLDAAGAERPLVVACSMGGQAAIDLTLAHPQRVAGLLLIGTDARALRAPDPGPQAEPPAAWPRLAEISVPTLMLIGRLDAEEILAIGEQAAQLTPGAELRWLDGVAHVPHLENDPATLDEIARFVANRARSG